MGTDNSSTGESEFMVRKRTTVLVLVVFTMFTLLAVATGSPAQQPTDRPIVSTPTKLASAQKAAKFKVPDNPSPHPAAEQPIPYSHKQHLAFGLKCQECHTNPEPGKLMTFPGYGQVHAVPRHHRQGQTLHTKGCSVRGIEPTDPLGARLQSDPGSKLDPSRASCGWRKM